MEREIKKDKKVVTVWMTAAACFIYMMNSGIRNNFGIMLKAISENTGMNYASVSFVLAVAQLSFGITQPVFGIIAEKKGSRFSLLAGIICVIFGAALTPICRTTFCLMLVLGILLPGGLGALSFGAIMGTISSKIPPKNQAAVNGIVNASSGIGNTLFAPIISTAIAAGGLVSGMRVLSILSVMMIPVTIAMCGKKETIEVNAISSDKVKMDMPGLFKMAFNNRNYLFIVIGFFTCGFHMAIITNHFATEIMSYGYSYELSAYAFSIYGVATIIGCLAAGVMCSRFAMEKVLGTLYASRAFITFVFFMMPKTMPVICIYIFLLGFTGSSTVTPVSGLCGKLFGTRGVTIFFSFAFFVHQIGGFLSAWLGGLSFESFGSYQVIWMADIILCLAAAAVSYIIKDIHKEE